MLSIPYLCKLLIAYSSYYTTIKNLDRVYIAQEKM